MRKIGIPIQKPFTLLRHGETEANTHKLACGLLDSPLTIKGRNQAENTGRILSNLLKEPVDIFHSSLRRSKETAELIALSFQQYNLTEHSGLNEHSFGQWEGRAWGEVLAALQDGQTPPYGESRSSYIDRTLQALTQILYNSGSETIIVAHGGTFFALATAYGVYPKDVDNCEIFRFEPDASSINLPWRTYTYEAKTNQKYLCSPFVERHS